MIGHHGVTLSSRLARGVLPLPQKGYLASREVILAFTILGPPALSPIKLILVHCHISLSVLLLKSQAYCEGEALQWKEFAIAVRLGGDSFTFCPPWWLKSQALAGAGYSAHAAAGVKFSVAKAVNTKDRGGQMAVFVRNISLAPTRHPNLNC